MAASTAVDCVALSRLLRNRVSAQQARERKKSYVSNLEALSKKNEQMVRPSVGRSCGVVGTSMQLKGGEDSTCMVSAGGQAAAAGENPGAGERHAAPSNQEHARTRREIP